MSAARCPHCAATLRGPVDWCSQCYADLRPAPASPVPPPPAAPAPAPGIVAPEPPLAALVTGPLDTPLALATAAAMADPLTAPLGVVAGAEPAAAAVAAAAGAGTETQEPRPLAAPVEGWPCVRCGTVNAMELMECSACTFSFGAELATPVRVPGTRQSRIVFTIGAVVSLLAMLALVIYLTTPEPKPKDKPVPTTSSAEPLVEEPVEG